MNDSSNKQSSNSRAANTQTTKRKVHPILKHLLSENIIFMQFLFLKLLAIIYLIAFTSLYHQISGLYGADGLLPINVYLNKFEEEYSGGRYNGLPTLFWLSENVNKYLIRFFPKIRYFAAEDNFFHFLCLFNIAIAIGILLDWKGKVFFKFWAYFTLWISYLSIFLVGQAFMNYQWDQLLLEIGFLSMFLIPNSINGKFYTDEIASVSRELLRWLAYRYIFGNGVIKLLQNEDDSWWTLNGLHTYYKSQPIPSLLARHFHFLPSDLKKLGTVFTLVVEIFIPIFNLAPIRVLRVFSALMFLLLQFLLIAAGSCCWSNILSFLLAIPLLDDEFLTRYTPRFIKKMLWLDNLKLYDLKAEDEEEKKTSFWSHFLWMSVLVAQFIFYFPPSSIIKGKINFDMNYLKENIINSYFLLIPLYSSVLWAIYSTFRYSIKTIPLRPNKIGRILRIAFAIAFYFFMFTSSIFPFFKTIGARTTLLPFNEKFYEKVYKFTEKYHVISRYGISKRIPGLDGRAELDIQGSYDGVTWESYEFQYKVNNATSELKYCIPHVSRLDWQVILNKCVYNLKMWVASQNHINNQIWLINMLGRLFANGPSVLSLLQRNPFEKSAPTFLRIKLYKYEFSPITSSEPWILLDPEGEDYLNAVNRNNEILKENLKSFGFRSIEAKQYPLHPWHEIPIGKMVMTLLILHAILGLIKRK